MTQEELPDKVPICSPEAVSYSTMTRESPAAARIFPAGEKETLRTVFTNPRPG